MPPLVLCLLVLTLGLYIPPRLGRVLDESGQIISATAATTAVAPPPAAPVEQGRRSDDRSRSFRRAPSTAIRRTGARCPTCRGWTSAVFASAWPTRRRPAAALRPCLAMPPQAAPHVDLYAVLASDSASAWKWWRPRSATNILRSRPIVPRPLVRAGDRRAMGGDSDVAIPGSSRSAFIVRTGRGRTPGIGRPTTRCCPA